MDQSVAPIFIVGMPRSGTSLLGSMFSAHPEIAMIYESHYLNIWMPLYTYLDPEKEKDFEIFLDVLEKGGQLSRLEITRGELRDGVIKTGERSHRVIFDQMMRLFALKKGKKRHGEKTPSHERYIGELLEWYPHARIIHTIRDPRAVVCSMLYSPYQTSSTYADALRWKRCSEKLYAFGNDERVRCVRYEDLVEDPQTELRRLCEHVGEEFVDAMLERQQYGFPDPALFPKFKRGDAHLRRHESVVQGPLQKSNAEKWKTNLSERAIAIVEKVAGYEMKRWGYEPVTEHPEKFLVSFALSRTCSSYKKRRMQMKLAWPHVPLIARSMIAKVLPVSHSS